MLNAKSLIIVVEDEPIIARDLKEILENEGFLVKTETDSVENAIELIKNLNPVLVLIDVNLKHSKDGIDIGNFLLEFEKIPYMYVTSYADKITIDRIKQTRPYGYITKPFKSIDIIINVNIILNNYKHRDIDIVRSSNDLLNIKDDFPFIIKKTIQFINDNVRNEIEINDLVKLTRWDKHHFLRMFTKHVGTTPYQYVLIQKMNIAMSLLIETENNIADIAYELGFNNHSNFSIRFKKITGQTPEDYRKKNKIKKWLTS
jgi:AraC-like DNA-binding protein